MKNGLKLHVILGVTFALFVVAGCATNGGDGRPPVQVSQTPLYNTNNFTPPANADGKDKPVYVLPKIMYGWNPSQVNEDGEWIGGHYSATIVEKGHWATLEEAQFSGRPFVVAGEGTPIIPTPSNSGPTGGGASEINVANLASRVKKMEANMPKVLKEENQAEIMKSAMQNNVLVAAPNPDYPMSTPPQEKNEGNFAPLTQNKNQDLWEQGNQSLNPQLKKTFPSDTATSSSVPREINDSNNRMPDPEVANTRSQNIQSRSSMPAPIELQGIGSTIVVIPYRPAKTLEAYEVPGQLTPLEVEYLDNGEVRFGWKGKTYRAKFTAERQRFILSE